MAECALGSAMNLWGDGCAFKLGPFKNKGLHSQSKGDVESL